jgi:uncharacterized membrane protein YedE/YeeE
MTDFPLIITLAFLLGCGFGALSNATRFCTLGAITDWVSSGNLARLRMWALAIAVAVVGTQGLALLGMIDLTQSLYTGNSVRWLSHGVGGLLFGIGMPLASGCGARMLTRLGSGNLKSLVVMVFFGLAAYMSLRGLFALVRVKVLDPVTLTLPEGVGQHLASLITHFAGLSPRAAGVSATALAVLVLLGFVFAGARLDFRRLAGGVGIGLCVVAGWVISGHLGYLAEHPETLEPAFLATDSGRMESLSFAAPVAYLLEWLMLGSDASRTLSFGIAGVLGVISGAALHSLFTGSFRLESFAGPQDLIRHLIGAILMGAGGVTALGCSIGQGITGISTLAVGSMITLAAMIVGCWAMLKFDEWRLMRGAM